VSSGFSGAAARPGLNILLLGPQGAGKGTQGKLLASDYGVPHIATGDMLRAAIAEGTELGRRAEPLLNSGQLVPDEIMIGLIRQRLDSEDTLVGFVLDGFPRTTVQAEALDAMLDEIDRPLSVVFEFRLPEEVCIGRLQRRAERRPQRTAERQPRGVARSSPSGSGSSPSSASRASRPASSSPDPAASTAARYRSR